MNNQKVLLTQSALWAAYNGLTSAYLVAFALVLGASNTVIGLLGAMPWLASILTQIPGAELVEHFSRKKIYRVFTLVGRLFWLPLLAAPFLFKEPIIFVVFFFLLIKLGETITQPAYFSLLPDIVPEKSLGEFTSQRFRLMATFGVVTLVTGGLFLKQFPKESPLGFAIMFAFGIILALFVYMVMGRLREPKYQDHVHHPVKEFLTVTGPMRKLVRFGMFFNFAYMLASPLVAVYLLKNLGLSYAMYGIVVAITPVSQALASHHIGKLTDRFGDKPVAILGHFGTAIVPLLFLLITKNTLWLLVPVQIYGGIVWAAANISRLNLIMSLSDPKKRAMQIAEHNFYVNIPLIVAPIIGGWLSENVVWIVAGIPFVFVISSLLRFFSSFMLLKVPEPRAKREYPLILVFKEAVDLHPTKGLVNGLHVVKKVASGLWNK